MSEKKRKRDGERERESKERKSRERKARVREVLPSKSRHKVFQGR
jgi:hypothetical protein